MEYPTSHTRQKQHRTRRVHKHNSYKTPTRASSSQQRLEVRLWGLHWRVRLPNLAEESQSWKKDHRHCDTIRRRNAQNKGTKWKDYIEIGHIVIVTSNQTSRASQRVCCCSQIVLFKVPPSFIIGSYPPCELRHCLPRSSFCLWRPPSSRLASSPLLLLHSSSAPMRICLLDNSATLLDRIRKPLVSLPYRAPTAICDIDHCATGFRAVTLRLLALL